jgi:iron complex transport system substrate-binding protein
VVLDTRELDSMVALDVTPVGPITTDVASGSLSYLQAPRADVEQIGSVGEPIVEAVAALRPDLILSNEVRHGTFMTTSVARWTVPVLLPGWNMGSER